jgi:hypothetical protein
MCKEELNQEVEQEEYVSDSEEVMEQIGIQEELKRIGIQDNPISKMSKETKNSDFYKESMIVAETVGEVFQKLLGYGLDYNNAISISNNIYQNYINEKLAKIQQLTQENNQV